MNLTKRKPGRFSKPQDKPCPVCYTPMLAVKQRGKADLWHCPREPHKTR